MASPPLRPRSFDHSFHSVLADSQHQLRVYSHGHSHSRSGSDSYLSTPASGGHLPKFEESKTPVSDGEHPRRFTDSTITGHSHSRASVSGHNCSLSLLPHLNSLHAGFLSYQSSASQSLASLQSLVTNDRQRTGDSLASLKRDMVHYQSKVDDCLTAIREQNDSGHLRVERELQHVQRHVVVKLKEFAVNQQLVSDEFQQLKLLVKNRSGGTVTVSGDAGSYGQFAAQLAQLQSQYDVLSSRLADLDALKISNSALQHENGTLRAKIAQLEFQAQQRDREDCRTVKYYSESLTALEEKLQLQQLEWKGRFVAEQNRRLEQWMARSQSQLPVNETAVQSPLPSVSATQIPLLSSLSQLNSAFTQSHETPEKERTFLVDSDTDGDGGGGGAINATIYDTAQELPASLETTNQHSSDDTVIPYNLFLKYYSLPFTGPSRPISALFTGSSAGGSFQYISQTEWLDDNHTPNPHFQHPLQWDYHTRTASGYLKVSLYDTKKEEVKDEDRIGSVIIDAKHLLDSASNGATHPLTFSLAHEDPAKHALLKHAVLTVEIERDTDADTLDSLIADAQSPSNIVPKMLLDEQRVEMVVECDRLPSIVGDRPCNPIAALFVKHGDSAEFAYVDQSEWLHGQPSPVFQQPMFISYSLEHDDRASTLVRLSIYDVEDENVRDEDRLGSVTWTLDELLSMVHSGQQSVLQARLRHEDDSKNCTLAELNTIVKVNLAMVDDVSDAELLLQ